MKTYEFNELTELEQAAVKNAYAEPTGYIYFDNCEGISAKQMRGIVSSLERKGIIEATEEQPFEAYPMDEYEHWFF